ncbi:monovalent cation/H(+) antiporter subunit G [Rubellicoccus peritrichatus]|uniref:Monovalent cation/H(+) antiporter subunit G n=1 Tax=Rubellicoccus peritrichatus TaxID=3080537 RepID=A0AAQ3QS21_9BACT|nr:monovalent cation/H(+) antiporter subunit G [Puniceicoccus sp. CR14]WOO39886.1 monovalent cation/H(+) antiporter subunit G [Puniceicoccus sp. CR14]
MNWVVAILMIAGAFFALVAAVGVVRMPDFYMRLHAATKAGAFGAALMLLAAALYFGSLRAAIMALITIIFFYLTAPVAGQAIGRAAYRRRVKLWDRTSVDELKNADVCDSEADEKA